jgi:hypothetical protein
MTRRARPFALAVACVLLLSACAGRPPAPVPVVQPIDEAMSCDAIQAEVGANTQRISELGQERGQKVAQNVVAGVTGAFLILPLFLMDFQNASGVETTALQQRNAYLSTLARQRCQGMPGVTVQAVTPAPAAAPAAAAR